MWFEPPWPAPLPQNDKIIIFEKSTSDLWPAKKVLTKTAISPEPLDRHGFNTPQIKALCLLDLKYTSGGLYHALGTQESQRRQLGGSQTHGNWLSLGPEAKMDRFYFFLIFSVFFPWFGNFSRVPIEKREKWHLLKSSRSLGPLDRLSGPGKILLPVHH